jgi:hypothetical protein
VQEADFAPTDQDVAVNQQYAKEIAALQGRLEQLVSKDVADFNRLLNQQSLGSIDVAVPKAMRGERE